MNCEGVTQGNEHTCDYRPYWFARLRRVHRHSTTLYSNRGPASTVQKAKRATSVYILHRFIRSQPHTTTKRKTKNQKPKSIHPLFFFPLLPYLFHLTDTTSTSILSALLQKNLTKPSPFLNKPIFSKVTTFQHCTS